MLVLSSNESSIILDTEHDFCSYASLRASLTLFKASFRAVLRSPASFFDTTPIGEIFCQRDRQFADFRCILGRILSRLSKDQDTLDTELAMTMWQVSLST